MSLLLTITAQKEGRPELFMSRDLRNVNVKSGREASINKNRFICALVECLTLHQGRGLVSHSLLCLPHVGHCILRKSL